MKNDKFTLSKDIIFLKNAEEDFVIFFKDSGDDSFFKLSGCDSDAFHILTNEQVFTKVQFKAQMEENYDMSGLELDEYVESFITLLFKNKLIQAA
ncbi:MAG: hypothetical protein K2Q18_10160 [Bdellovibrionales bacterium]|nr:hypothetical protein [Bdellovibrionales bacterium]